jgi:hypothetical protein
MPPKKKKLEICRRKQNRAKSAEMKPNETGVD